MGSGTWARSEKYWSWGAVECAEGEVGGGAGKMGGDQRVERIDVAGQRQTGDAGGTGSCWRLGKW